MKRIKFTCCSYWQASAVRAQNRTALESTVSQRAGGLGGGEIARIGDLRDRGYSPRHDPGDTESGRSTASKIIGVLVNRIQSGLPVAAVLRLGGAITRRGDTWVQVLCAWTVSIWFQVSESNCDGRMERRRVRSWNLILNSQNNVRQRNSPNTFDVSKSWAFTP